MTTDIHTIQGFRYARTYPRSQDSWSEHENEYAKIFGVYDGHGKEGHIISQEIAEILPLKILRGIHPSMSLDDITDLIRNSFISFMESRKKSPLYIMSGSTVMMAVIYKDSVIFACAGDSLAAWSSRGETFHTDYHDGNNDRERDRLSKIGVPILFGRVGGTLAITRAFGDTEFQKHTSTNQWIITPEPEIHIVPKLHFDDGMFILATDGAVERRSVEQLVYDVYSMKMTARQTVAKAIETSTDDTTVMIVTI